MLTLDRASLVPEPDLVPGNELLAEGRAMARDWHVGPSAFLSAVGVPSEATFKRREMARGRIMLPAQIGYRDIDKSCRAYAESYETCRGPGVTIDRYGLCLDWSMGYAPAMRARGLHAGEEAASAATHEQIASVARANAELEGATGDRDFKKVMQKNREFHFGIYGAANMPSLARIIERLWLRTGSYLNLIYPEFGIAHKGIMNHERAVAALRARNGKELRAAIENDISYAAEHVIAVLRMRASAKNGQR
ncbi:MAG TPA: FCD domain-containing protein [Stellaceae bacterium]|nr:FCD domain-containing protein [Stellaceae bacterium]